MINISKRTQKTAEIVDFENRRRGKDRRVSNDKIRFPFIDDDCKLVMKERRAENRRTSDVKLGARSLKAVSKILKK